MNDAGDVIFLTVVSVLGVILGADLLGQVLR